MSAFYLKHSGKICRLVCPCFLWLCHFCLGIALAVVLLVLLGLDFRDYGGVVVGVISGSYDRCQWAGEPGWRWLYLLRSGTGELFEKLSPSSDFLRELSRSSLGFWKPGWLCLLFSKCLWLRDAGCYGIIICPKTDSNMHSDMMQILKGNESFFQPDGKYITGIFSKMLQSISPGGVEDSLSLISLLYLILWDKVLPKSIDFSKTFPQGL